MDNLNKKLKKLFTPKPKKFRGQGNVLGSRPEVDAKPQQQRPPVDAARAPRLPPQAQSIPPGRRLGAAQPAPQRALPAAERPQPATAPVPAAAPVHSPATEAQAAQEVCEVDEEVALAFAHVQSDPKGREATEVLQRVLRNILAAPGEAKYRRLRLRNKRIQEAVVDVAGGVELLQACGFQLVFEDAAAPQGAPAPAAPGLPDGSGAEAADAPSLDAPTEAFAELPPDADLAPLRQALQLLAPSAPGAPHQPLPSPPRATPAPCGERAAERPASGELANGAAAGSAAADSAQPRPRNTQVLLPGRASAGAAEEGDSIFQRSAADVRAEVLAAQRRREQDSMLMTRAMREKLAAQRAGGGAAAARATHGAVRVRLPDGLIVQGEFGAGERVEAVYAWLTEDCLADPGAGFALARPDRAPLPPQQSLRAAGLLPSCLLNFSGGAPGQPVLRRDLLAGARPA